MNLAARIARPGPRRLLAIDGGGIRGVLALEILRRIEDLLRPPPEAPQGGTAFRLAHAFDYIAGTSTGGIIAAGLALGMSVDEIARFYETAGPQMFARRWLPLRLFSKYRRGPLAAKLQDAFGRDTTLGSDRLQTLLLLVMRNASTDSPWPLSNNPYAKYNDRSLTDCNLDLPLWQLLRASTAAPTYFPPERIELVRAGAAASATTGASIDSAADSGVGSDACAVPAASASKAFDFVDGGITTYNNPAFQMALMATLDRYWALQPDARWKPGADRMLVVSVGTGTAPAVRGRLRPQDTHLLFNAKAVPAALMHAALNEQDLLCRVFGDCLWGAPIDGEVGDLIPCDGPLDRSRKLFTYLRYNASLTRAGLDALGCRCIEPEEVQKLDAIGAMDALRRIGRAAALDVKPEHFAGFMLDQAAVPPGATVGAPPEAPPDPVDPAPP